jgi:hypothetical protein
LAVTNKTGIILKAILERIEIAAIWHGYETCPVKEIVHAWLARVVYYLQSERERELGQPVQYSCVLLRAPMVPDIRSDCNP